MSDFKHIKRRSWNTAGDALNGSGIFLVNDTAPAAYEGFKNYTQAFMFRRTLKDRSNWRVVDQ